MTTSVKLRLVKDMYEVVINNSITAYRNEDMDKAMAWIKLHYKINVSEVEI